MDEQDRGALLTPLMVRGVEDIQFEVFSARSFVYPFLRFLIAWIGMKGREMPGRGQVIKVKRVSVADRN
jgi:hypothetical protein